jgi:hypothetical protein
MALMSWGVMIATRPVAAQAALPAAAVKITAPRSIDGDPAEWAGQQAAHSLLGHDGVVTTFKLAYDAARLYALIRVTDDSPLKNGATVREELLKGGDALGLCFGPVGGKGANQRLLLAQVDGKPYVLAMRPLWPEKRPYQYFTQAAGTVAMEFVGAVPEVQAALKPTADGYLAEVAIPWTTLGLTPTDGLQLPFDLQTIFSDPAGTTNLATAWWHSTGTGPTATMDIATEARLYPEAWGTLKLYPTDPGPRPQPRLNWDEEGVFSGPGTPITFTLPRPATVSLIIQDDNGWVVRELVRAQRLGKGAHTVYWNGRDRSGQPMPPGTYRYRVGYFDGVQATFQGSVGNSGRPVYRTADGLGSIGGTHGGPSAVAADGDGIYMLHSVEEGQQCLRKVGLDGKAKWFASTGVFGSGLAVAADEKYAYMVYQPSRETPRLVRLNAQSGRPVDIGTKRGPIALGKIGVNGLAVVGDKAYIASTQENRLLVLNLTTGDQEAALALPAPAGLCRADATHLLACSGAQVVTIDTTTREIRPLLDGLTAPRAVAVDRAGTLYVSELGDRQQIGKFSPQGKRLATVGTAGGRAVTVLKYDPLQFRNVTGLTLGPDGTLWLVEQASAPRRFARLTPEGQWLEDFYGPTGYVVVGVDLDDPSTIYYQAHQGSTEYIRAKIDYAAYARDPGNPVGAWRVEALYNFTQNGQDRAAQPDLMAKASAINYNRALAFTATNGKRYFWLPGGEWCGLWLWEGGRWLPAAAIHTNPGAKADYRVWADQNGDGLVQPAETAAEAPTGGDFVWIGRDLTLYTGTGEMKPASVDARGVPTYAGGAYTRHVTTNLAGVFDQVNYFVFSAPPAPTNTRYLLANVGPDRGLNFWDRAMETRLAKIQDGKLQWVIGHHDGRFRRNGDNIMLMNLAGEVDGVILAAEVNSNFTAYTSDGLTLGWVCGLDARGKWADVGPSALYVENVQPGLFLKDPKTGKRLLIAVSTEDVRVLAIDGVFGDQITRIDGTVTLPSTVSRGDQLNPPPAGQWTIPYATWAVTGGGRFLGVDGYGWEWDTSVPAIPLSQGKALVADVRLRRDAGMLCVLADVLDTTPFDGTPPSSALEGREGLELFLGPAAPAGRLTPAPGDTRILLTALREGGKLRGLALACRPASEPLLPTTGLQSVNNKGNFQGQPPTAPIDFRAGYTPIPGATVAIRERLDGRGYCLEAEIPLALVPELATPAPVTIKRQQGVNVSEVRLDLAAPIRFNLALLRRDDAGTLTRLPWVADRESADPKALTPAAWGMANAQVAIRWAAVDGAQSYTLFRSATPDPAKAAAVKRNLTETTTVDIPGLGDFFYWLAATDARGEGQWFGPVQAREGQVRFPAHQSVPPVALEALPTLYAFPGATTQVNVRVDADKLTVGATPGVTVKTAPRGGTLWTLAVLPSADLPVGTAIPVEFTAEKGGKALGRYTTTVRLTNVPVTAYGVLTDAITNSAGRSLEIDATKPADGEAGAAAATINWTGEGAITQRAVGRHGFVLFRWQNGPTSKRLVLAPFVDTFAKDGFGQCDGYNGLTLKVDGVAGSVATGRNHTGKVPQNAAGSAATLTLQATDTAVHTVTLVTTVRGGHAAPPARFTVGDPTNKVTWTLAEFDGSQGHTVVQFRFIGACTLTVTQTARDGDGNNRANIAGLFLD